MMGLPQLLKEMDKNPQIAREIVKMLMTETDLYGVIANVEEFDKVWWGELCTALDRMIHAWAKDFEIAFTVASGGKQYITMKKGVCNRGCMTCLGFIPSLRKPLHYPKEIILKESVKGGIPKKKGRIPVKEWREFFSEKAKIEKVRNDIFFMLDMLRASAINTRNSYRTLTRYIKRFVEEVEREGI